MTHALRSALLPLLAVTLGACCSTNRLSEYTLAQQPFLFQTSVASDVSMVHMRVSNPATGSALADILVSAGSDILSSEAQAKLARAVKPAGLAVAVSAGVERVLTTYCATRTVRGMDENPAFIVETRLLACEMYSDALGIGLSVEAETNIIDRATARVVWEERGRKDVPLRDTPGGVVPIAGTATSIFNAIEFFRLSDAQIQDALLAAAEEAGRALGDELREDYADSRD